MKKLFVIGMAALLLVVFTMPAMAKVKPTYMLSIPLVIEKIFRTKILPKLTNSAIKRKVYKIPWVRKKLHKIAGKKTESFVW